MKVDAREIIFIKENAPVGFPRLIVESLEAKGIKANRVNVHMEISTIKENYNDDVINEARRLLKVIKDVEYQTEEA